MKTIKTIKAVSAAILLTAGLASAQVVNVVPGQIDFSVSIVPTGSVTLAPTAGLDYSNTDLFRAGVTVTSATASGPIVAGRLAVSTNLAQWDVFVESNNEGKLLDAAEASLACSVPTTNAPVNIYACVTPNATAACGLSTVAAPNNATISAASGRRAVNLAGSSASPISLAKFIKGTATAPLTTNMFFTGAEKSSDQSTHIVIEANIPCARSSILPGTGADGSDFEESLTFTFDAVH